MATDKLPLTEGEVEETRPLSVSASPTPLQRVTAPDPAAPQAGVYKKRKIVERAHFDEDGYEGLWVDYLLNPDTEVTDTWTNQTPASETLPHVVLRWNLVDADGVTPIDISPQGFKKVDSVLISTFMMEYWERHNRPLLAATKRRSSRTSGDTPSTPPNGTAST